MGSMRNGALAGSALLLAGLFTATPAVAAVECDGKQATIVGTPDDDTLRGTPKDDVIAGLGGSDSIDGRGGNDTLCGGGKGDGLVGGAGDDALFGGRGADGLDGGDGNDTISTNAGPFHYIVPGPGDDVVAGDSGEDQLDYSASDAGVVVDLGEGTATGQGTDTLAGIEIIYATRFDDTITGDDRPNVLVGRDGDDTLSSGGGGRLLLGFRNVEQFGASDVMFGGNGDDTMTGGEGFDMVGYFDAPAAMTVNLAIGVATGEGTDTLNQIEGIGSSRVGDTLIGDGGDNAFALAGGDHTVDGGGGEDIASFLYALGEGGTNIGVEVDLAAGTATGQGEYILTSIESVLGTVGPDTLSGNAGANVLKGRGGDDELFGLAGDDHLRGDKGNDSGDGGEGSDICSVETKTACEG
ncbi:MAG TPA: hypothetical protein VJ927_02135 [Actinomycetota bacterium]|nr:hypothetical protein [Actinomycetota bacterium]